MPDIREYRDAGVSRMGHQVEVPLEPALRASTVAIGSSKTLHSQTRLVMVVSGDTAYKYDVNVSGTVDASTGSAAPTGTWFFAVEPGKGMVFDTAAA